MSTSMNTNVLRDIINVGDAVCTVVPQECKTPHAPGILGIVRKIYYDETGNDASAYGVEASGEIIYYFADQIKKVPNIVIENLNAKDAANRFLENMLLDSILTSYENDVIEWPKELQS